MTNHPWSFSIAALKARFGFERLEVINDFTAQALALPRLGADERMAVGGGTAAAGAPLAVLGPGSGLGVSGLVPCAAGWVALTGEGGHATMSPASDRESAVLDHHAPAFRSRLRRAGSVRARDRQYLQHLGRDRRDPVKGLYRGADHRPRNARRRPGVHRGDRDVLRHAGHRLGQSGADPGARGGLFIAGGIVPRLGHYFADSPFRARFQAKGRFEPYLAAIPTYVVDPSAGGLSRRRGTAGELTRRAGNAVMAMQRHSYSANPDAAPAAGDAAATAARPGSPAAYRGAARPGAGAADRTPATPGRRPAAKIGGRERAVASVTSRARQDAGRPPRR